LQGCAHARLDSCSGSSSGHYLFSGLSGPVPGVHGLVWAADSLIRCPTRPDPSPRQRLPQRWSLAARILRRVRWRARDRPRLDGAANIQQALGMIPRQEVSEPSHHAADGIAPMAGHLGLLAYWLKSNDVAQQDGRLVPRPPDAPPPIVQRAIVQVVAEEDAQRDAELGRRVKSLAVQRRWEPGDPNSRQLMTAKNTAGRPAPAVRPRREVNHLSTVRCLTSGNLKRTYPPSFWTKCSCQIRDTNHDHWQQD
jgi:hypothetical protein